MSKIASVAPSIVSRRTCGIHWLRRHGLCRPLVLIVVLFMVDPLKPKNPPTNPPFVGCGSTPASAMLSLWLMRTSGMRSVNMVERTMAQHYQITVKGYLDTSWSAWFDGLSITHDADDNTRLTGAIRDQTALYGLIDKARDLALNLIAGVQLTAVVHSGLDPPPDRAGESKG